MYYSSMNTKGIISQIELIKEIIQNYIEAYNTKRLDEDRKVREMICEEQPHRKRPL